MARTRDLIFMCCTMQTRISATIIIRFLVLARNDDVEANSKYYTFVLVIKRKAVL